MIGGSILAGRTSFAFAVGTVCVVALACLLLPLLVREREPAREPTTAEFGFAAALRETLANRPFQVFLVSKCLFWLGVRSAIAIVPFFVAGVLRFPERQVEVESALLVACCVGPAFGWLGLMKPLVRRFSKRRVALAGLACLGLGAGLMATVGVLPVDRVLYARLILAVSGFSLAVVFAVPNAILADLVDLDERRTGARREAMYFGSQGFFVKVSWGGASALVMAAQGAFHADPATATRVCWIAIAAVSALAFAAFLRFPEDRELRQL
jgi:GPH family glycoside/pentoside/hexuronide:cation symporter